MHPRAFGECCLITDRHWTGPEDRAPYHESDAVIYELHVRGFTKNPNQVSTHRVPGTSPVSWKKIPYLKELGVTVVE